MQEYFDAAAVKTKTSSCRMCKLAYLNVTVLCHLSHVKGYGFVVMLVVCWTPTIPISSFKQSPSADDRHLMSCPGGKEEKGIMENSTSMLASTVTLGAFR